MKRTTKTNLTIAGVAFLLATVAMFLVAREPTEPLTEDALAEARQRWQTSGVSNYQIRYEMHGSRYDVTVRGGIVTDATVNDAPLRSADPGAYSVEGLFRTLELELDNLDDPRGPFAGRAATMVMRVRFNEALGYVERYLRSSGGMGRGASIVVISFEPKD